MPRGRPKKIEEKTEATLLDVYNATKEIGALLGELLAATKRSAEATVAFVPTDKESAKSEPAAQVTVKNGFPVPLEYRELVDTLLNKKFDIDIEYLPSSASFQFSILVPREYSNATESHWATAKEDRRSRVIENAHGANGVREWVTKVYENFPDTTKSAITYDRAQL